MIDHPSTAARRLGVEIVSATQGEAVLTMPTGEGLGNRAETVHGGYLALLADTAMSRALGTVLPEGARRATFDLKLSFIAPARIGLALRAVAKVVHAGRRTGVTECRVEDSEGRLVATATASFFVMAAGAEAR